jgi:hypothetical protein
VIFWTRGPLAKPRRALQRGKRRQTSDSSPPYLGQKRKQGYQQRRRREKGDELQRGVPSGADQIEAMAMAMAICDKKTGAFFRSAELSVIFFWRGRRKSTGLV